MDLQEIDIYYYVRIPVKSLFSFNDFNYYNDATMFMKTPRGKTKTQSSSQNSTTLLNNLVVV